MRPTSGRAEVFGMDVMTERERAQARIGCLPGDFVAYPRMTGEQRPWQPISPFHQAIIGGPLGAGMPPAYAWMVLATVVVIAAALPVFERRDVAVH